MKKTTYFKLNKPEYSDPIDIDEITDAFDTIDTALMESRKENELTTNSINEDVLSPYYSIRNTNDFEITVVEREFGTEYKIGAGNQKKVEVYNRGTKMNYYVKDLHEAKFTWFTLGGSGGGSGTSNYNDLSNKPQINGTTLSGNKSLADIGILNSEGKIKSDLLPAFVDNYDSYANRAAFPATGVEDRLYLAQDTRLSYVWDTATSDYVVVGSPLALGEAEGTAYRGDRGKIAYEHSQATHARTDATAVSASTTNGKININGTETTVYAHPTGSTETNPHNTTASDVGLADALKYSEQVLSLEQKTQARTNIGAGTSSFSGSYSDLSNIPSEFTPASHTHAEYISKNEQTLTSAEKAQARKNIDAVGETTISSVESTVSVNTVPECLGYAGVKMIGGKTQKVVQLLQHGNMDGSGWSAFSESYLSVSMSNNELTATVLSSSTGYYIGATNTSGLSIPKNHVILVKADFNPSVKTSFGFDINYVRNRTECNANTYTTVYDRFEALDNYSGVVTSPTNMSTGDTYKVKNFQIFDLTAMFGSGNEPTTEQFIAMFNEAYYPYGNYLYSASVEKIVSSSKNVFDADYLYNKFTSSSTLPSEKMESLTLKPNTQYRVKVNNPTYTVQQLGYWLINVTPDNIASEGFVGLTNNYSNENTFTTSSDGKIYINYNDMSITGGITKEIIRKALYETKVQIEEGTTATTYSDTYFKNEISLAEITKNLPDYGCSVGDVYNWVDFENGVYHRNVKSVKANALEWDHLSGSGYYSDSYKLLNVLNPSEYMLCSKYEYSETTWNSNCFGMNSEQTIWIGSENDPSSDANLEFVFTLKTPEVKPISAFIPPIHCEEGGTITLANTHSLDVPNTICYKKEV